MARICFLVLAHYAPEQVRHLTRTLTEGGADVVVHVDPQAELEPFREPGSPAVYLDERIRVYWGGWSQVAATLALLRRGREAFPEATHYWLTSGDSFPLRPLPEIAAYLDESPGTQYINLLRMPNPQAGKPITRLSHRFIEHDRRSRLHKAYMQLHDLSRRPYKKALRGMQPYAGSQWWTITRDAADLLLGIDLETDSFARLSQTSFIPDEHYVHTLLGNAPAFAGSIASTLMYADWRSVLESGLEGRTPRRLVMEHLDHLEELSRIAAAGGRSPLARYPHALAGCGMGALLMARKIGNTSAEVRDAIQERIWPLPLPPASVPRLPVSAL